MCNVKISIVTNAFNQGKFLRRCIDSVFTQSYLNFEYFVVDPGSTDETHQILAQCEFASYPNFKILLSKDAGPADGLNKAFSLATGDWFFYLNADDYLLPGGLRCFVDALGRSPNVDCLYGDGLLVDVEGKITRRVVSSNFSAKRYVMGRTEILQQSTFYRAASFRKVGGFNASNHTCWDGEILLDMAKEGMKIRKFNGYVGAFVIHPESISGSGRLLDYYPKDYERMRENVIGSKHKSSWPIRIFVLIIYHVSQPRRTLIRIVDSIRVMRKLI